jgi:stage II sporulation protein D
LNIIKLTINILLLTIISIILLSGLVKYETFAESPDDYTLVGLKYSSTSVDNIDMQSTSGFIVGKLTDKLLSDVTDMSSIQNIRCIAENGSIKLLNSDGSLIKTYSNDYNIIILPNDYQNNGIIFMNNIPYRGGLALKINILGKIDVINRLSNQEYLYGVVHMEMSQANPIEALKAQAVAARNFLYLNRSRHIADGFEVCNTTHCQVYGGFNKEYIKTNQAVDETKDILIYYDNTPIVAYYHKNSGGYTQNSENVWTTILSYLRSIRDKYSPEYKWTFSSTKQELAQKLMAAGMTTVGDLKSVAITAITPNGYVSELELIGTSGIVKLSKEKVRAVFGYSNIKSMNFNVASGENLVFLMGSTGNPVSQTNFQAISSDLNYYSIKPNEIYLINGDNKIELATNMANENSDSVTFNGSGYGHGIGMSQDGAIEMAKLGYNYQDILKYYYTGVEIK